MANGTAIRTLAGAEAGDEEGTEGADGAVEIDSCDLELVPCASVLELPGPLNTTSGSCGVQAAMESKTARPVTVDNVRWCIIEIQCTLSSIFPSKNMKLFLDTANTAHVAEIAGWGILDGVTTNPSLVAKEGKEFKPTILEMCKHVPCVSAQVTETESAAMIKQGLEYASWHKNVYVKVPMTVEGLKTLKALSAKNIRTNTTLVFTVEQALLAAKAGATIVSPFVGRLDDKGEDGMAVVAEMVQAFKNYGIKTEVLVASVRSIAHVHKSALIGAHIATMPYAVMQELPNHPLTDAGLKKFLEDWESVKK